MVRNDQQKWRRCFDTRLSSLRNKIEEFKDLTGLDMVGVLRYNGEIYSFGPNEFLDILGVNEQNRNLPRNDLLSIITPSSTSTTSEPESEPSPVRSTLDSSPCSKSPTETPLSRTPSTPQRSFSSPCSLPLADRTRRRGGSTSPLRRPLSRRTVSPTPLKRLKHDKSKSLESLRKLLLD